MNIEGAVMNVKSIALMFVLILGSVIGGTWALAAASVSLEEAKKDIAVNQIQIEKIDNEYKFAINDVKSGQRVGLDKIEAISRKFDLLLLELRVRNVVTGASPED